MIKQFPEIKEFFEQDHFKQDDLERLQLKMNEAYPDEAIRKKARELIKLKLLFFKLSGEVKNEKTVVQTKKFIARSVSKNEEESLSHDSEISDINLLKENIDQFIGWKIEDLSKMLEVSENQLLSLFVRKNIELQPHTHLTKKELSALEEFLVNRIKRVNRNRKLEYAKSLPKRKKYKSGKRTGRGIKAYDAIQTHGLGKLIYIRRK